jgi:hypothetical protein
MAIKKAAYFDFYNSTVAARDESYELSTTDATTQSIKEIALPDYCKGIMNVTIIGVDPANIAAAITGKKFIHFSCIAGTATVDGSEDMAADVLVTLTTATWVVNASGGSLRIRVTGEAATDIAWTVIYEIQCVEYTAP